jgi:hypothetical protein
MATIEDWPDASEFPYIALIRIRFEYQVDSVVAGVLQRSVARLLGTEQAVTFAKAINTGVSRAVRHSAGDRQPLVRSVSELARALDDFDELCPRPRHPWPHFLPANGTNLGIDPTVFNPQPEPWRQAGAAEAAAAVLAGLSLIREAGSEILQKELEPVLQDTLQALTD